MVPTEDFSFPKIRNPLPHFVISPSLWRVSSVVYPDDDDDDQVVKKEEKMDMLWEDFNEELQRVSSSSLGKKKECDFSDCESISGGHGHHQDLQLCCMQALKMAKTGTLYRPNNNKRQSMVFMVKFLKKMFLLHKSSTHL